MAVDVSPRPGRIGGLLAALWLLLLLHLLPALVSALPRACWLTRLERRWIHLWMR